MKPYDHPGDSELLLCTGGPPGVDCNKKPVIAAVADDADSDDPFYYRGQAFCENHWPTPETSPFKPTYPRWEVRPDEPGGLAWVTDPDEFEDNGFDIEELFRHLDWSRSKRCKEAVAALVEIVKAATS